jgi:ComF family protein
MFDLLFPSYCINCGRVGQYLCTKCQKKLKNTLPECYACRRLSNRYLTHKECNRFNINSVFVGWQYDSIAKKFLSQYKYRYASNLAKILSNLLIQRIKDTQFDNLLEKNSLIIPIPITRNHLNKRGFNQSSLIARNISKFFYFNLRDDLLLRKNSNKRQSTSTLEQRRSLGNVFTLSRKIKKRNIILIDDVMSTATTVNRAAKVFKGNRIQAIVLFRGHPRYQVHQ